MQPMGTVVKWGAYSEFEKGPQASSTDYEPEHTVITKLENATPRSVFAKGVMTMLLSLTTRVQTVLAYEDIKGTLLVMELGMSSQIYQEMFIKAGVENTRYVGLNGFPYVKELATSQGQYELLAIFHEDITVLFTCPAPAVVLGFLSRTVTAEEWTQVLKDDNIKAAIIIRSAEGQVTAQNMKKMLSMSVPSNAFYFDTAKMYLPMEKLELEVWVSTEVLTSAKHLGRPTAIKGDSPRKSRTKPRTEFRKLSQEELEGLDEKELEAYVTALEANNRKRKTESEQPEWKSKLMKRLQQAQEVPYPP